MNTPVMSTAILLAHELITPHLPPGSVLTIKECSLPNNRRYTLSICYTSHRTGRKMSKSMSSDVLPRNIEDLRSYTAALVLSPQEVGMEFSRIAWYEKRARQDVWLSAGKLSNNRVINKDDDGDMIPSPYQGGIRIV